MGVWISAVWLLLATEPAPAPAPAPTGSPGRVELRWRAPPQCPDQAEVLARTEALLLGPHGHARADAQIVRAADGFALTLALDGRDDGPEHHWARSCDALADVAALVVAIAADPTLATPPASTADAQGEPAVADPPAHEPPAHEPPANEPPANEPPANDDSVTLPSDPSIDAPFDELPPAPSARARPPLGGLLGAHGVFGSAELPGFDVGAGVLAAIAWRRWRAEFGGSYLGTRRRALPGQPDVHASMRSWNSALAGCVDFVVSRVRLGPCLGAELGVVSAIAEDAPRPIRERALWVAAIGRAALRWPADERVQLTAAIEGVLALRRPSFALRERLDATVATRRGGVRATLGFAIALGHLARNWPRDDQPRPSRRSARGRPP